MPENHELEKQIEELKALVLAQSQKPNDVETALEKTSKFAKYIQSIVALVIIIVGLGVNWGISTTKISVLEQRVASFEELMTTRIGKTEQDIHELQLKQAADDQLLQTMQSDITEIKTDVKKIIERRVR
jgi:hypothetical protein